MCGTYNKSGVTLLEVVIALLLMGVLASLIGPNIFQRGARYERQQFIARINALVQLAWQQAIIERKVMKVEFDFAKKTIQVQRAKTKQQFEKEQKFEPLANMPIQTRYEWPQQFEIKQFVVEGQNLMGAFARGTTDAGWFFLVPDGLAQQVIINFTDTKDTIEQKSRQVGMVLNPFTAQFNVYDIFQK